ncbi:MAG: hypothetical protein ACHQ4J_09350 [Candidatus Binatia bacterium]
MPASVAVIAVTQGTSNVGKVTERTGAGITFEPEDAKAGPAAAV